MTQIGNWSFTNIVQSFPHTVFPNTALWNVNNGLDLNYQIQVSWPLEWSSRNTNASALTMFVLDGNALGMTAAEAWRRRRPVESTQPDSIVVSIGYPLTSAPYSPQRGIDFQPPTTDGSIPEQPGVRSGADDFIEFIDEVLRPWVRELFPKTRFERDALYGHSFGGLFVVYALLVRPDLFDTFLSASPALFWNGGDILTRTNILSSHPHPNSTKPAFKISYGSLEQFPVKRRTETEEQYQSRKDLFATFAMTDNCNKLYDSLRNSSRLRDVQLMEYRGTDHAAVGAVALSDGIDYFIDW
ncbi:hypothetical protein K469DRAFT_576814 [Zopfia rhizophila CBS 207.26]|uniref:Siderophore esteras-like protein IroE-like protein n=1 Tax=Zopfia rhizophila CBS 207.26 TaxID=1314779 RepID=A0A6A6E093_9PEZI|nr:hypothetical protein K469DRAFT_576814 [Zopfia rhizophila CBS 207.26]